MWNDACLVMIVRKLHCQYWWGASAAMALGRHAYDRSVERRRVGIHGEHNLSLLEPVVLLVRIFGRYKDDGFAWQREAFGSVLAVRHFIPHRQRRERHDATKDP